MLFYTKTRLMVLLCVVLFLLTVACAGDPAPNPDGRCRAPSPCQVQP